MHYASCPDAGDAQLAESVLTIIVRARARGAPAARSGTCHDLRPRSSSMMVPLAHS